MKEVQQNTIKIAGSAHNGRRGEFSPRLFVAGRSTGAMEENWDVLPIPVEGLSESIRVMGLAMTATGLVAVAGSAEEGYLATFDHNLQQTGWHPLPGASDPHSLVIEDDQLWVVSSRSNEVIQYTRSASGTLTINTVFRSSDIMPQHFNGLVRHRGVLVVSALGVSGGDAHDTHSAGYLLDVEREERIQTGLDQPHSLYSYGGSMLLCESRKSLVLRDDKPLSRLEGYLRGLVVGADGMLHVAESAPRPRRGELTEDRPDAAIWTLTIDGQILARNTLKGVGAEIYDLVALT